MNKKQNIFKTSSKKLRLVTDWKEIFLERQKYIRDACIFYLKLND